MALFSVVKQFSLARLLTPSGRNWMPFLKVFGMLSHSISTRLSLKWIVLLPLVTFVSTRMISRFLATILRRPIRFLILSLNLKSNRWIADVIKWLILFVIGHCLIVVICPLRWIILVIFITL
ncbi:hypothetical protein Goshw_003280 [Gossypium schwendimanii]|uniref:Uncharacterized protein n=1 Tax=Gossypium schwendimanii TaxID=34291 RepID=A0A7J9KJG7_GOSSC|nr:hypothetical protein [Gossypium schwendimanii]